jgi:RimJ/RimL family protein N-acetyltransferase
MKTVLETERLCLREMNLDDLDFVASMIAHPEVMRYYPKLYNRSEAQEWIERQMKRYAEHGHGLWLVLERASGQPVGQTGLIIQEVDGVQEPEIGYLIHRPFWRRGFATEAALGVREYAFARRALERVIALIHPDNVPSQGVARKLGMECSKETIFKERRHLVFAVTRAEVETAASRSAHFTLPTGTNSSR